MNGVKSLGVVCFCVVAILISGCTGAGGSDYVEVRPSFGSGSSRYRISPWSEINDWLVSGADNVRSDGVSGYECFVDNPNEWNACVYFSPSFYGNTLMTAEGLTLYCENLNQDVFLPLKGFPKYCKGIYLDGHFDLSRVRIGKGVEYLYIRDYIGGFIDGGVDCNKAIPSFEGAGTLRYLELTLRSDEYEDAGRIPVLDAMKFLGLDQLSNLVVDVDFLIAHVEKLSECKSLQKMTVESSFAVSESDGEDLDIGTTVECNVDDSSFDEFINRDFSCVEQLEVMIDLKESRTWDISSLAKNRLEIIKIIAKNCFVTGMESFRHSKTLTNFWIKMEIAGDVGTRD